MDADERLADYLSGELDPDEHAAFEAALARDAALRARVAAARRADDSLRSLGPTALPEGFEARLHEAVDRELQTLLPGGAGPAPADTREAAAAELAARDELAARRAVRAAPAWTAVAGAAAVVALIAGVVGLAGLGTGADSDAVSDMAAPDTDTGTDDAGDIGAAAELFSDEARPESDGMEALDSPADADAPDAEDQAADDAGPPPRPVILGPEREVDDQAIDALLFAPELRAFADAGLDAAVGDDVAAEFLDAWRAADVDRVGVVDDREAQAVLACVDQALTGGGNAIPVIAELVRHGDRPGIALGLVARDEQTGRYDQTAVLLLDRETCAVMTQRP